MEGAALAVGRLEGSKEGLIEDVAFDFDDLGLGCLDWIDLGVFAVETTEDWKFSILFFLFCQIPMHDPAAAEDTKPQVLFLYTQTLTVYSSSGLVGD